MESTKEGIAYKLYNFKSIEFQTLQFTEKTDKGFVPGTTNEEVVNVLIDRFYSLQKKGFSAENQCVIIMLKNVRALLAKRLNKKIDKLNRKTNEQATVDNGIKQTTFDTADLNITK